MYTENDIDRLRGAVAYDRTGERIGNVGEVYLDDQTGEPMWVTVHTGFFGMNTSFVPLADSTFEDDDRLVVAHDKQVVKDAPNIAEDGHLDRAQEDELYHYYGVVGSDVGPDVLRTRRWQDQDRLDLGQPHSNRGYAGDTGDLSREPLAGDRAYEGDPAYDGPLMDRDRDGRGPVEEVLDGPDDPTYPRRS